MNKPDIKNYHAHIYYSVASRNQATELREAIIENGGYTKISELIDEKDGPHISPMFQIIFSPEQFSELVQFLVINHGELSVLIHPNTGDLLTDHQEYAMWLGNKVELDFEFLRNYQRGRNLV